MEEIIYYIGQVLGAFTVVLGVINYQMKTREQVLFIHEGKAEWTGVGSTIDNTESIHLREFLDHA